MPSIMNNDKAERTGAGTLPTHSDKLIFDTGEHDPVKPEKPKRDEKKD